MKRITALLLALLMLFMVACSAPAETTDSESQETAPQEEQTDSEPADDEAPAEGGLVTISWWGTQAVHDFTLEIIEMYTEKTGYDVEPIYASWGDYWTKMNTLSAAGDLPDIMEQDYQVIEQYASKGLIAPLESYVESGELDMSNVDDATLAGGLIDGSLYGINIGSNSMIMVSDVEQIEAAGLEAPTNDMTWEQYETFVTDYYAATGMYGAGLKVFVDSPNVFEIYARGVDEALYDVTGDVPVMGFAPETLAGYMTSLKALHDAGAVQGVDTLAQETSGEDGVFAKGEAVTDIAFTDMYATYTGVKGKQLGINVLPGAGPTQAMYVKPSKFFSIGANSEMMEGAFAWINMWTQDEDLNLFLNGRRGVPISNEMADLVSAQLDENGQATFGYMSEISNYASPIGSPSPSGGPEVVAEYKKQMELMLFGESTPEQAAADFVEAANAILEAAAAQ